MVVCFWCIFWRYSCVVSDENWLMYMAFFASNNTQCTDPVLVLKLPWSMRMIVETNDRLALLPNYWRERREEGGQSPTWISWFIWKHTNWLPWCWWGWDEEDEERIFRRLSFQRRLTSLWILQIITNTANNTAVGAVLVVEFFQTGTIECVQYIS